MPDAYCAVLQDVDGLTKTSTEKEYCDAIRKLKA